MSETTQLEARVDELAAQVEALRAEVGAMRERRGTSMRAQHRCPHCNGTSLLHVSRVRDHNYGDAHTFMAIQHTGLFRSKDTGRFELYVCRSCEFAEWYVVNAADIDPEKLDKENRKHIRIIDELPPAGGVFR